MLFEIALEEGEMNWDVIGGGGRRGGLDSHDEKPNLGENVLFWDEHESTNC